MAFSPVFAYGYAAAGAEVFASAVAEGLPPSLKLRWTGWRTGRYEIFLVLTGTEKGVEFGEQLLGGSITGLMVRSHFITSQSRVISIKNRYFRGYEMGCSNNIV